MPSISNKVSAVGGTSIVYNSAGAFTSYGSSAYNWNATGQISFISTSGSTVGTYTYNASNQRTKKVAGGKTVHYVYGLGGLLYGEYDGSGALIREYVYQNDAPLAQIDAGSPEVLTYLHTDHLGTPKYGTNSGGTSVWAANTDPFGVGTPSGSRTVNLRMAGQYYDSESGLFYNWNRYYHPALGRYISSDPIGLAGGPNTFNYASVSPVMFVDPRGENLVALGAGVLAFLFFSSESANGPEALDPGLVVSEGQALANGFSALVGVVSLPFRLIESIFFGGEAAVTTTSARMMGTGWGTKCNNCWLGSSAAITSVDGLGFTRSQLQHAFKHAKDFGVSGNPSNKTLSEFSSALQNHVDSVGTRAITGTYRGNPVTHHFNPSSGLNVIRDSSGNFLSGWKLSPQQRYHVLKTGKLGGG